MAQISVLLVDDNPTLLRVLSRFLEELSAGAVRVVGTVLGGREAEAQALALQPDIVVVDLQMPDVPGLALLPRLRVSTPRAKIIALTLMDPLSARPAALAAGAHAFVSKAAVTEDLVPVIQCLAAAIP